MSLGELYESVTIILFFTLIIPFIAYFIVVWSVFINNYVRGHKLPDYSYSNSILEILDPFEPISFTDTAMRSAIPFFIITVFSFCWIAIIPMILLYPFYYWAKKVRYRNIEKNIIIDKLRD